MRISKFEAANLQLDRAIQLCFDDVDPISTHTLLGASSVLIYDLVEKLVPNSSWENHIQIDNSISKTDYIRETRKAQNFFKHADKDPLEVLEFDRNDTLHLLFITVSNCHILLNHFDQNKLSDEQSIFELWYLARTPEIKQINSTINIVTRKLFPGLDKLNLKEQLEAGKKALFDMKNGNLK